MPSHPASAAPSLRNRLFHILHRPAPGIASVRYVNYFLMTLIVLNCAAVALETMPEVYGTYAAAFRLFEAASTVIYLVEYVARVWVAVEQPQFGDPLRGRLRYMVQWLPALELLVILTFFAPVDLRFLRVFRMVRFLHLLHLDDFEHSLQAIVVAVARLRTMLVVSVVMMTIAIYCTASVLYMIEHRVQPDKFSSIPATLWWAFETLTTIGYGDVFPVTPLGKLCTGVMAIFGIGIFALPTAILTSAILDATHAGRNIRCAHCGKPASGAACEDEAEAV